MICCRGRLVQPIAQRPDHLAVKCTDRTVAERRKQMRSQRRTNPSLRAWLAPYLYMLFQIPPSQFRHRCLARAIADAERGELRRQVAYKAQ